MREHKFKIGETVFFIRNCRLTRLAERARSLDGYRRRMANFNM